MPIQEGSIKVVEDAAVEGLRVGRRGEAGGGGGLTLGLVAEAAKVVERVRGFSSVGVGEGAGDACTLTLCRLDLLPVDPLKGSTTIESAFRLEPLRLLVSSSKAGDSGFEEPSLLFARRSIELVEVPSSLEMPKRSAVLGLVGLASAEALEDFLPGELETSEAFLEGMSSFFSVSGEGKGTRSCCCCLSEATVGVTSPEAGEGKGSIGMMMLCRLARGVECPCSGSAEEEVDSVGEVFVGV